ncbi:hypothetical protein JXA31_00365 [Candidatus Bathyarchaeota archaeon]|nr:hypothetical protein [Candidatus Bathyarchaeota archaeon]
MKKLYLFLIVLLGFLITACATMTPVSAQHDFDAFLGNPISDNEVDGAIGSEWDDAGNYTGVAISPQGTAEVWTKHDGTYLYMAVRFTADSDNPWVAFLFGGTTCMATGADGALFGHDSYAANGYRDILFNGFTSISVDTSQDGTGAMTIDSSNLVTVELKKPLSSGDFDGKDVAWTENSTYALIIMWNSNLYGASGGSVTHSDGPLADRTMLINSNVIPEFPGLMFTVLLVATTISAFLLRRRITAKPMANVTS